MEKSKYTISQVYVTIINSLMNLSYRIDDFVTLKHDGGYSNDVFSFGNKYILKIYFNPDKYKTEKKAVEKLTGCDFLADGYHFYDNSMIMIMYCSLVKGEVLKDYVQSKGKLPSNFLDAYYGIRISMLEKGVDDNDYKLDSLIWSEEGSVKKFDFDVVNFIDSSNSYKLQSLREEYDKLKSNDSATWDSFMRKYDFMTINRSIFDDFRRNL